MSIESVLAALKKVKKTGNNRWVACCPAHGDKNASMSVMLTNDGRVMVHCFSQQCDFMDIAKSAGLKARDFFPDSFDYTSNSGRINYNASDALQCLEHELYVARIAIHGLVSGKGISKEDYERIAIAHSRILSAFEWVGLDKSEKSYQRAFNSFVKANPSALSMRK